MTSSKKILIILNDTDPLFARVCRSKFSKETGWEAVITEDYSDALSLVAEKKPDILLTEIILTGGRTGFELIEEVRGMGFKKEDLPIVVFSDLKQDSDKDKAFDLGATHYFIKSEMMISDVVDKISEIVD